MPNPKEPEQPKLNLTLREDTKHTGTKGIFENRFVSNLSELWPMNVGAIVGSMAFAYAKTVARR